MVVRPSRRKVGSTRKVSARLASRLATASQVRFELRISELSWPWRSDSALKTSPVLRISRRVAPLWTRSTFSTSSVFSANGVRLPSASLIASPWPRAAKPCWSSQVEKR